MADDNEAAKAPAAKEPEPEDESWANSEAKRVLRADVIAGRVKKHMKPKEVIEMRPRLFGRWKKTFGTNLRNLREALARDYSRMLDDCQWHGHDAAVLVEHRKKFPLASLSYLISTFL